MFNRLKEAWFEFKGIRSDDMGVFFKQMPTRTVSQPKYTRKSVNGRNGTVLSGGGEYVDAQVQIEVDVVDEKNLAAVLGWLTGIGELRFSDEPDLVYTNASIEKEFSRKSVIPRATAQRFTVKWVCDPFRKAYPEAAQISIVESGETIMNPGTAEASPVVRISGSGDFSVSIGMQTMFFSGVEGGVIIDSELGDVFNADGTLLANDKADGELFKIQPGINAVSWIAGGENGGSVESVTILPRWRYL